VRIKQCFAYTCIFLSCQPPHTCYGKRYVGVTWIQAHYKALDFLPQLEYSLQWLGRHTKRSIQSFRLLSFSDSQQHP